MHGVVWQRGKQVSLGNRGMDNTSCGTAFSELPELRGPFSLGRGAADAGAGLRGTLRRAIFAHRDTGGPGHLKNVPGQPPSAIFEGVHFLEGPKA